MRKLSLVLLLLISDCKKSFIIFGLFLFAAMSPLGAAVGEYLKTSGILTVQRQNYIVAFVVGSFLHIATTILFEMDNTAHHKIPFRKLIAISVGIGMAILTL